MADWLQGVSKEACRAAWEAGAGGLVESFVRGSTGGDSLAGLVKIGGEEVRPLSEGVVTPERSGLGESPEAPC